MEALSQNIAQIVVNGKNITADITPYISRLSYDDRVEAESDDISIVLDDIEGRWRSAWYPQQGDTLTAVIGGADSLLDCGVFEIDQIEYEFPPDTVTIKGIATSITKALRTKNSKAFEKQSLFKIAQYFANKHGLKLYGSIGELQKIEIDRKTQERQTDLSFLAGLAREYGIVFSVRGAQLVFMDNDELEAQPSILTLGKNDISRGRFCDKTSQIYGSATVATRNVKTNSVHRWTYTPSNKWGNGVLLPEPANTLETASAPAWKYSPTKFEQRPLTENVYQSDANAENETQAEAIAKGSLKDKNKDKITGSITIEGNIKIVAGVNIELTDFGNFSGKWHVVSSSHSIDNSGGYVTDASIRKVIEK